MLRKPLRGRRHGIQNFSPGEKLFLNLHNARPVQLTLLSVHSVGPGLGEKTVSLPQTIEKEARSVGLMSPLGPRATARLWDPQLAPSLGPMGPQGQLPRTDKLYGQLHLLPLGSLHSSVISAQVASSMEDTAFHFCAFKCLFPCRLAIQDWNQNVLNQSSPLTPPPSSSPGAETPNVLFSPATAASAYALSLLSLVSLPALSSALPLPGPEPLRGKPLPHYLRAKALVLQDLALGHFCNLSLIHALLLQQGSIC